MTVLLLGGTNDAKYIATQLHQHKIDLVYSIAGLVRQPDLPCKVISGGFTQYGGLSNYIQQHSISMILDSTHPYAEVMIATAIDAAKQNHIAYWRYQRPAWKSQTEDRWQEFGQWDVLVDQLAQFSNIFLTIGQLDEGMLQALIKQHHPKQLFLLRTAVSSPLQLPGWISTIKQLGSFKAKEELSLMKQYHIDVLVSKNSGGSATEAKLIAARELQIPVFMLQRPLLPASQHVFDSKSACISQMITYLNNAKNTKKTKKIKSTF